MKTVVAFKLCKDPTDAIVSSDGAPKWGNASLMPSDDDCRAAEIAAALGYQTVALTLGGGDKAWAAARGAEETYLIADAEPCSDAMVTASVLAKAIEAIGDVDLVLVGDSGRDPAVAALLGAKLGWSSLAGVLDVRAVDDGFEVVRRSKGGDDLLVVSGPAVFGVVATEEEATPPGMKAILAARKKPVVSMVLADLGGIADPAIEQVAYELPSITEAIMLTGEGPEELAESLFGSLKEEGVL